MKKQSKFKFYGHSIILTLVLCLLGAAQSFAQRYECLEQKGNYPSTKYVLMDRIEDPKCKQAIGSLKSAGYLVWGYGNEKETPLEQYLPGWLRDLQMKPDWKSKFDAGLTLPDATKFLKDGLVKSDASVHAFFANRVIKEVYGRDGGKAEIDYYVPRLKEGKETYTSIFLAEQNKLNKNPAERKLMIDRAYLEAMGRNAKDGDIKYWQTRKEVFREINVAGNKWLYTPEGALDLEETIYRAFAAKGIPKPTTEQYKKMYQLFTKEKMSFNGMKTFIVK